jgi:hypothetical protein
MQIIQESQIGKGFLVGKVITKKTKHQKLQQVLTFQNHYKEQCRPVIGPRKLRGKQP